MLNSIAIIGKSLSNSPLDGIVDSILINDVFVVDLDRNSNYMSIELEQRDSDESKYLYKYAKEGIRPGKFLTCLIPRKDLNDLRNNIRTDRFRSRFITSVENHRALQEILARLCFEKSKEIPRESIDLLERTIKEIISKKNIILNDLRNRILNGDYGSILLTYRIGNKYLGEIVGFPWFLEALSQGDKSLISNTLKCIICHNFAVHNRLKDQLPFFTIDNKTFLPDGDDITNSAKVLPLCSTCYNDLKKGVKYIQNYENHLDYDIPYIYQRRGETYQRKGKLRFWLVPQLNDLTEFSLVQEYLRKPEEGLSSFKSLFDLSTDMKFVQMLRAQKLDESLHIYDGRIMSLLTFTVLFYRNDKFRHMRPIEAADAIYPWRLEELVRCKRDIDKISEKTGNCFRFYFGIFLDFFEHGDDYIGLRVSQKEKDAGWMKSMSHIMASVFTNKQLDEAFISKVLLTKAQLLISKHKLQQWYEITLKATLILEYLYRIRALSVPTACDPEMPDNRPLNDSSMVQDARLFLISHPGILQNSHFRGVCAIGMMVGIIIKAQTRYLNSENPPFLSHLNRLEMDFDRLISLPSKAWPKLKYYDADEFESLFTYLVDNEIANIDLTSSTIDKKVKINLIFTVGMAHGFTIFDKFDHNTVKK